MKIFNTLSRKIEDFTPLDENRVRLFVCGPTVYGPAHAGHAKTYTQFDFIATVLRKKYPSLYYLQNITDIDDKIINKAINEKRSYVEVAREWETHYHEMMKRLGNNAVDAHARALDHIPEVISQVERLLANGNAYIIPTLGVYFDTTSYTGYKSLAPVRNTDANTDESNHSRVATDGKRHDEDFVVWKFAKPHEPSWESSFGAGRPGWHIEDTAIAERYLGSSYDIHGGATDLIFPHHEAEILQMEALTHEPLVNYWLHTGLLSVEGTKMGKSLNNFVTVEELLEKWEWRTLRYAFLSTHYRSSMEINDEVLLSARAARQRVETFYHEVALPGGSNLGEDFWSALEDDFNTPKALAVLFTAIREAPSIVTRGFLEAVNELFGGVFDFSEKAIPEEVRALAEERQLARTRKEWHIADELRVKLGALGWTVKDSPEGYILQVKS